MPNDDQAKRDYFDSIHHGAAVVGINTSALVEAAIVGRPVHTVLTQRYRDTQEGAVHFNHLVHGPLVVSPNMDDHVRALAGVLDGDSSHVRRNAKFLATFVRPRGLDRPAAPLAVDALEEIATQPSERVLPRRSDQLIRASLRPVLRTAQYMAAFGNGAAPSVKPARTSGRRGFRSTPATRCESSSASTIPAFSSTSIPPSRSSHEGGMRSAWHSCGPRSTTRGWRPWTGPVGESSSSPSCPAARMPFRPWLTRCAPPLIFPTTWIQLSRRRSLPREMARSG